MTTFEIVLMMLLVADALALGGLVLLQHGRGADVGAAFGSGSSSTMFGSSGSGSFLTKMTTWLAIGFFVISFGLAYAAKERASTESNLGVPSISVPLAAPEQADEGLTEEEERVDSDIPDL